MNFNRISIIIVLVLLIPLYGNNNVVAQDDTKNRQITGLSVPEIDGFINTLNPQNQLGEWEDGLKENINLVGSNNEVDATLHTKFVAKQLFVAMNYPSNLFEAKLQIDLDNSGDLSKYDILLSYTPGTLNQLSLDSIMDLNQIQNEELLIKVLDGSSWIGFQEFFDLSNLGNEVITLMTDIADVTLTSSVSRLLGDRSDTSTHLEFKFNPLPVLKLIDDPNFSSPLLEEESNSKDIGYSIAVRDMENQFVGYPVIPQIDDNNEIKFEGYSVYDYLDFVDISFVWDVGISALELTQAVQYPDNSLSLVRDKQTLARVFVTNNGAVPAEVEVTLRAYTVVPGPGVSFLGTQSKTFTAPLSPDRTVLSDSANFVLPDDWTSHELLYLKAEVDAPSGFVDNLPSDNKIKDYFFFQYTHDLNIYYMKVNTGTASAPNQVSEAAVNNIKTAITETYPVANPNYIELDWSLIGTFSGGDHALIAEMNKALGYVAISIIFQILAGSDTILPLPDQIVGIRPGGGGHSDPSWNDHGVKYSFATTGSAAMTIPHEINHNLGPGTWGKHVSGSGYGCDAPGPDTDWQAKFSDDDIHALGWSPSFGLIQSTKEDFMSYCGSGNPSNWISDYRWEKLFERLRTFDPGDPVPAIFQQISGMNLDSLTLDQESTTTTRSISGLISADGVVTVDPSYELPGYWLSEPQFEANVEPTHYLEVTFSNGSVFSYPIYSSINSSSAQKINPDHVEDDSSVSFSYFIEDNGEITGYKIYDASTQDIYVDVTGTGFTANVVFNLPTRIDRLEPTTINWEYDLTNKSRVYFQLEYSPDGNTWYPVGDPTTEASKTVSFEKYPGSSTGSFRLSISDGFETKMVYSQSTVEIPSLLPAVQIKGNRLWKDDTSTQLTTHEMTTTQSSDVDIQSTLFGSTISLHADAYDPDTGDMGPDTLSWKIYDSEMNQILSNVFGNKISFSIFETGQYTIEVTAKDINGDVAKDRVIINLVSPDYLTEENWNEFKEVHGLSTDMDSSQSDGSPNLPIPIISVLNSVLVLATIRSIIRRNNPKNIN